MLLNILNIRKELLLALLVMFLSISLNLSQSFEYILDDEYHYPYLCHDTDRDVTRINHEYQGGFHILPPTLEMVSAINRHK